MRALEEARAQSPVDILLMEMSAGHLPVPPERLRRDMPPWLEVLLDILGFAGFIGIATLMKSPGEKKQADR
jgi:hypothetical protein